MITSHNVDMLVQRAVTLGLIRLESGLPTLANTVYRQLLKDTARTLETLRQSITIRIMAHDYADLCSVKSEEQLKVHESMIEKGSKTDKHNPSQFKGLTQLEKAKKKLPEKQKDSEIHNPNIIVNCDSGTVGELGCKSGNIKVYQAIYSGSYGENGYKDVYLKSKKIVIYPAKGGKCNVSIGNPFRIAGWYMNYVNQGSTNALIRCWEIPQSYFETMLEHCGTEWEVKKAKGNGLDKEIYVEMCDHKAPNQFGLWTHEKTDQTKPTAFGAEFLSKCSNLITYYDPNGTHKRDCKDGILRSVGELFDHLGIPGKGRVRFHDLGTALTNAKGNLSMNQWNRAKDLKLLDIIHTLGKSAKACRAKVSQFDKTSVRMFSNVLSYNNLNPQKLNKSKRYTTTGLNVRHLKRESRFMFMVYKSIKWHWPLRKVIKALILPNKNVPMDVLAELPDNFKCVKTYPQAQEVLLRLMWATHTFEQRKNLQTGSTEKRILLNTPIIDSLNRILRPICSQGNAKLGELSRVSTKNENFLFQPLKDQKFEIGASHRISSSGLSHQVDSLSGHKGAGFSLVKTSKNSSLFSNLSNTKHASNTEVQLMLHNDVIQTLNDKEIPVIGGISGTTRDIFQYCSTFANKEFWPLFQVVAAFMIKFHYHSLSECFIAANQYYRRNDKTRGSFYRDLSPKAIYNHVRDRTGIPF